MVEQSPVRQAENTSGQVALSLQDITIGYGKTVIVKGISLEIRAGETFGLIGLNGAGKTSLIKAILGLHDPLSGTIKIFGHAPGHPQAREKLSYLPERFEPAWFLTGLEFLRFSLKLYKKKIPDADFVKAAETLNLDTSALRRKVQSYSKGMRQKLGLLGAILTDCPFLILDEPMSGLDPVARALVKDRLTSEKKKGHTIFLSSHILADMDEICDRVAVLHQGQICYTGTPENLKKETGKDHLEKAFLHLISK